MPAALDAKEKAEIVDRLFVVFQDHGYEGASLADLSRATGLGKSSLYHHFPGGKEQMAEAVLEKGKAFIQAAVADVAKSAEPLKARVRRIVAALDQLYANGRNPCVLGRLAVSEIGPKGRQLAHDIFSIWTDGVAHLARETGMSQVRARQFAEDWIARVQGSLILYAANGDCSPFERAMNQLLELAKEKLPPDKRS
ncbi:TetR/AcrR family transcriptional regulator [Occallatibacter riparius]|uniref:TetR/AcrR family transcriptional regulator n=1 Tax=Occallatibacter riparius TaxID=1002689 RepID=A0A9J7BKJ5_9BACT|nr:TetR/AcrR family transcriptional regulator [Occallatibacter riparius]UWZ81789.1 TetR/AcrR family transcriptional regulator [Occallatibacter riparius]